MSKRDTLVNSHDDINVVELEEGEDLDLDSTDVGFLLDKDGNLKTIFGPEESFTEPNEVIAAIMSILGVDKFMGSNHTLH
jgi:phosphoglucomutase